MLPPMRRCPTGRRTRSPARSSRTRRGGGWCSSSRRGGRPERVDLGEGEAVRLDIELARDRQERLAAKEILREIDPALLCVRQVGEIQRRHPEQCPGTFRVGGGDDRRIDPEKAVLVKEAMGRLRQGVV